MNSPKTNAEWASLIDRLRARDDGAMESFAENLGILARSFFRRGGQSPSEAEDLAVSCVSDIVLLIFRNKFDGRNFRAWSDRIFRNKLADKYRRRVVAVPLQPDDLNQPIAEPMVNGNLEAAANAALEDAITKLDPDDREIVIRHAVEAVSLKQLADELGVMPVTARVRFLRARRRLKKILQSDERMLSWLGHQK